MKARPFLALVLVVSLMAFGLGLGGWWLVWRQGPLALAHHALSLPRAARYVPRQAPFSLYVFADGEGLAGYARAVAPPRQRRGAAAAIDRLRDGVFAAAGLDYSTELAGWLAPEIGLAVFEDSSPLPASRPDPASPNVDLDADGGWLLALSSRDDEGARRFLQRFWQMRSLAGADLQVSSYRGMGLISGRGSLLGGAPVPLATALVDGDLVLIASGRGVLEQALDVSQIDELNQAGQGGLIQRLEAMGQGAALLVARPEAMGSWLGLPLPQESTSRSTQLVATLQPQGRSLRVEGVLDRLGASLAIDPPPDPARAQALLAALRGNPSALAVLRDPAALMASPLLRPFLERAARLEPAAGPIPALVAAADHGPLLVAQGPQGWLLNTYADTPDPAGLESALAAEGLTAAPLQREDGAVLVWTRLLNDSSPSRRPLPGGEEQLRASLAGWRTEADGVAWWGRSLALLDAEGPGRQAAVRRRQLDGLDLPLAPLRWALGAEPARDLLDTWAPWRILSALAGGGFDPAVRGMALALEPQGTSLAFQGRLEFG